MQGRPLGCLIFGKEKRLKEVKARRKQNWKKIGKTFVNVFLLAFMLLIFGPAEIFFANVAEFEFVYGEFAGYLAVAALGGALFLSLIIAQLPDKCYRIAMSVIFGISAAGYVQVMFLNRKLDLLGLNPDGYHVDKGLAAGNLCIWLGIILVVLLFALFRKQIWEKIVVYASVFLLAIQLVALLSLILTAREEAYVHSEGDWHLTGQDQYVVSANENVIVIILDCFSNQELLAVRETYPEYGGNLKDFTYYNNADCNYYGTFPSLAHMLSGQRVDASIYINDWTYQIWTDPDTIQFYEMLREKNYVTNVYTPDIKHLCGTNDPDILRSSFSNMADTSRDIDVFYKLLFKTMAKMSCYRMAPELAKNLFYTEGSEYADIIGYTEDTIYHKNDEFYTALLNTGLSVDGESNYFIVQHLAGMHEYAVDANCQPKERSTVQENALGCMLLVEEYVNQLKELGVYDNSTIIITADHGDMDEPQIVFFIKEKGVTHDTLQETNAPIELADLRATIAEAVGAEDYSVYGHSIHEFKQDQLREREVWIRQSNPDYKMVPNYVEDRIGYANVYHSFKYVGDYDDLMEKVFNQEYEIIPMADSFF